MSPVDFLRWRKWRGQPIRSTHGVRSEGTEPAFRTGGRGVRISSLRQRVGRTSNSVPAQELGGGLSALFARSSLGDWKFESISLQRRVWCELRICGDRRRHPPSTLSGVYAFDVVILLSSAGIGISSRSLALRRVQSMSIGAALVRLMRIAWVGVAITLSG
jgi:hypothetical protein